MSDTPVTCTCGHPRGDHLEGGNQCQAEGCQCLLFIEGEPQRRKGDKPARKKRVVKSPQPKKPTRRKRVR